MDGERKEGETGDSFERGAHLTGNNAPEKIAGRWVWIPGIDGGISKEHFLSPENEEGKGGWS